MARLARLELPYYTYRNKGYRLRQTMLQIGSLNEYLSVHREQCWGTAADRDEGSPLC